MSHKETVSIVGLGQMGAALARAYIHAGHRVTVWNRSHSKAEPFQGQANVAATPAQACSESDLTIISLSNYEASDQVFRTPLVAEAAKGRTLVQLTSGTPGDARSGAAWASGLGIRYLDGCILAYPSYIGGEQTPVFYSGPRDHYERHESTLRVIGGATSHVGEAIGAAAALDCALLGSYYGATLAFLHGAAICASENFSLDAFFERFQSIVPLTSITADMCKKMLATGDFKGTDCTLDIHTNALQHIVRLSQENNVDRRLPELVLSYFNRALQLGHGADEIAAVFNAIQDSSRG
ncbi:NAD(P)-binding domain-containing protein [Nannocystis sp. SCPEA4]|uniref:NAD(P)-dependent oxidoreductase n=1 Tax=Nannocystis sp. SCPEA4 TaxID=2996787 RepID=UPI00226FB7F7|nr:NAD(P)-binding domain-containing protein [Nannocystis sp. SCPEA4]MCY1061623.1 NAD(P)-binding domain-containing protein [Nannocystis sp. SCPEA4]